MPVPRPLAGALLEACERFSRAVGLEGGDERLTFDAIAGGAATLGARLRAAGITEDEPVLIRVANRPHDVVAFLGVWHAGAVAVPVHRAAPDAVVDALRRRCGSRLALDDLADAPRTTGPPPPPRALLHHAACVIFTSGSTGEPKGVVIRHDRQLAKLRASQEGLRFGAATRFLVPLQITFVFGLWASLITLLHGGTVVLHERFQAAPTLDALANAGITDLGVVPTMLRALLAERDLRGGKPSAARVHAGGETLDAALSARVRTELTHGGLVNIYGSTETCGADFLLMPHEHAAHPGSIGRPSGGVHYRIAALPGASGGAGELQVRSAFVMAGYLDAPDLTAAAFDGDFYRTGDLARERDGGVVEVVGRLKELIVKAGRKIAPLEIERLFAAHPAVEAALSTGVPDPQVGERIHLLVVPRGGAALEAEALRDWARERIERYKLPDAIHVAGALPLGRTGKVDRARLRALIERGEI